MDSLEDHELSTALRGYAREVVPDVDAAELERTLAVVRARARVQRVRRRATLGALAVAAAAVGTLTVGSVVSDQQVVRTPASTPSGPGPSVAPSTPPRATLLAPATTASTVAPEPETSPAATAPSATTAATPPTTPALPAQAVEFPSDGGSITVRRVGTDGVELFGPPRPNPGYTADVQDRGPERVRVRFVAGEDDGPGDRDSVGRTTEIRVRVVDGELRVDTE